VYGLRILWLLGKYSLHKSGLHRNRQFESLHRRYSPAGEKAAAAGNA
jgi:hypothetical protein